MSAIEFNITSPETGAEAPSTQTERPDNVPEKFWDAEKGAVNTDALLSSYAALETKMGAPKAEEEATPAETPEGAEESATGDEDADKIVEEAGLDVEAIESHWLEHGTLPEAELEKLAKVGVTKEMAEEFVAYRAGQADRIRDDMYKTVGGEEAVNKMVDWAGKTFTKEQADRFNTAVNSGDQAQVEYALKALKADYDKANGVLPKLLKPTSSSSGKGDSYQSLDQLLKDQADPRYAADPAFRANVMAKLQRSEI